MRPHRRGIFVLLVVLIAPTLACTIPLIGGIGTTATPTAIATATRTPTPQPTATPTLAPTAAPSAIINAGEWARFNGDWDKALTEFQTALNQTADLDEAASAELGMSMTLLEAGRYAEANQALTAYLEKYQDHVGRSKAYFLRASGSLALGDHISAIEDLDQYLELEPDLLTSYVQEQVGDIYRGIGLPLEAIPRYQFAMESARSGGTLELQIKLAHSYFEAGDYVAASEQFDLVYYLASEPSTRSAMNLLAGRALEAVGDYEGAFAKFQDSIVQFPEEYESYLGLITLVDAGVYVDEFLRGVVDYHAEAYGPALAAFDRYLVTTPTSSGFYYRGLTKRALGDPYGAIQDFQTVIDFYSGDLHWTDAWFERASTERVQLSDSAAAVNTYLNFVSAAPGSPNSPDALNSAARILERDDQLSEAALVWLRIPQEYSSYWLAYEGAFLSGVTRYRLGEYGAARDAFLLADATAREPGERAAAKLWVGKTYEAEGDLQAARLEWGSAADIDPTGYYSVRAHDLLVGRDPFKPASNLEFPSSAQLDVEREEAELWLRAQFGIEGPEPLSELDATLAQDARLLRGEEFWRLGLYQEAKAEFETMRRAIQHDAGATYRLMHRLLELGLYQPAIFAARNILNLANLSDAETLDAPVYFNRIRFGTYYQDIIFPEATRLDLDVLFVLSVVRQESLFESFITSYADARGLMQVIPSTGLEIAQRINWPPGYQADDLYRTLVSVRFGVEYLAQQRDLFDGDLIATLSAYNAGPGNTLIWKELAPQDPDLFLEVVRLDQPQRYIRGIYEMFAIYRALYASGE
ncbi:MAG: tetratricopeptide repeat protein [Anaerolineales bacterium]|nr:tetratricopeptide repeat protein [Anaerolineales bacterium]